MCTLGFQGKGYSEDFVENYLRIARDLRETSAGDEIVLEVAADTDSICEPCPNRREKLCTSEEKIRKLDRAHAAILGLSPGDRLSWKEAKQKIARSMTLEAFHEACAPCSWKALGVCEAALKKNALENR